MVMRGVMMAVRSPGAEELHVDGSCSVPPPRLPPAPGPGAVLGIRGQVRGDAALRVEIKSIW